MGLKVEDLIQKSPTNWKCPCATETENMMATKRGVCRLRVKSGSERTRQHSIVTLTLQTCEHGMAPHRGRRENVQPALQALSSEGLSPGQLMLTSEEMAPAKEYLQKRAADAQSLGVNLQG